MRKYLHLITEHDGNEDHVGLIRINDSPWMSSKKDEETTFYVVDEEKEGFEPAGKHVSLGYVDFEAEDPSDDRMAEAIHRKLGEIDEEHLEKAGIDPQVLADRGKA